MTAALTNNSNVPFGFQIDGTVYPQFLSGNRAPTTQDVYTPGTRWQDNSTTPPTIYETTGAGSWTLGGNALATTSTAGIVRLSTLAQLQAGSAPTSNYVPSANDVYTFVTATAIAGAPIATQTVFGITKLATDAIAVAGTANNPGVTAYVVQPSNLAAVFAAPPTIGGTTPGVGTFTTLNFATLAGTAGGTWLSGGTAILIGTDSSNDNITIGNAGTRTVTIGSQTSSSSTVIDSGTGAINIGTAVHKTITIGNVTTSTAVAINAGTGSITLTTASTGDIILNSTDTVLIDSVGVLELNSSAGVISIGNDAVSQNINLGTAGTRLITIGNVTASTEVLINVGTDGLVIDGVATSPYAIGASTTSGTITIGGTAQTGNMTFGSSSANYDVIIAASTGTGVATLDLANGVNGNTINIGTGINTATQTINIATGASAAASNVNILTGIGTASTASLNMANNTRVNVIGLGNIAPAAARTTTIAGGNQAQNDTVNVLSGAATANTQTFAVLSGVGSGTHAKVLNLANTTMSAGTATVNIMSANATTAGALAVNIVGDSAATAVVTTKINTGGAAHILTIGNAASGAQTWNVGTGNLAFVGGGNTIFIAADVATNTINIGTGAAAANTISIGGTGANVIAIGNTQTAGSVAIGNAMTTGTITLGGTAGQGTITIGKATNATGQNVNIASGINTGPQVISIANGAGSGDSTVNIQSGNNTAGTIAVNIVGDVAATRAATIKIGTGTAAHLVTIGSLTGAAALTLQSGTGGISLATGATTPGLVSITPNTASTAAATSTVTLNSRVLVTTWTGFTTAAAATQAFTIVSNKILTTSAIIVTVANLNVSTNGAQMSLVGVTQSAGQIIVNTKNNGSGALGGGDNVLITVFIMS